MWRAIIRGGAVEFVTPAVALNFANFKPDREGAKIVIEEEKAERTQSELRMYRAWLRNVAKHSGNDENKLHERKKRTSGGTSLTMDKQEMAEFTRRCAELTGYPLPTEEELRAMGYEPNTKAPLTKVAAPAIPYPKEGNNLADIL